MVMISFKKGPIDDIIPMNRAIVFYLLAYTIDWLVSDAMKFGCITVKRLNIISGTLQIYPMPH